MSSWVTVVSCRKGTLKNMQWCRCFDTSTRYQRWMGHHNPNFRKCSIVIFYLLWRNRDQTKMHARTEQVPTALSGSWSGRRTHSSPSIDQFRIRIIYQLHNAKPRFLTDTFGSPYDAHPLESFRRVVVPDPMPRKGPNFSSPWSEGGERWGCEMSRNVKFDWEPPLGEKHCYGHLVALRKTSQFVRATGVSVSESKEVEGQIMKTMQLNNGFRII